VQALPAGVVADVTAVLSQNPSGKLPNDAPSATISGTAMIATSVLDSGHAWEIGYTPNLAMAVWVGNRETEFPLYDRVGRRITGDGLPADIYRAVVTAATKQLGLSAGVFPPPGNVGSPTVGDAA